MTQRFKLQSTKKCVIFYAKYAGFDIKISVLGIKEVFCTKAILVL